MNLINYTKKTQLLQQEVSQNWMNYIACYLPQNIDDILRKSGCVKRFRGVSCGIDLLKMLFLYVVSGISFNMLSFAGDVLEIGNISATAWRKKFASILPFLKVLLSYLLSSIFPKNNISTRNVYLVDGSIFRQEGKDQKQQRVHMCYHLNENHISQIKITDIHTAESLMHFSMNKDDIFIADGGYGTAKNFAFTQENDADVILRINCNLPLYDAEDKRIDLVSELKKAKKNKKTSHEIKCFVKHDKKSYRARLIFAKLPEEKALKSRKRKQKKAIKNQRNIKDSTLTAADYVILITSMGIDYDKEEILHLYKSRWQIELLFKRIKQNFNTNLIRSGNEKYAETIVYIWLIIWLIVERQVYMAELYWSEKNIETDKYMSTWDMCQCLFIKIKEVLEMTWSLFIDFESESFREHLSKNNGRRIYQNADYRNKVLPSFVA